MNLLVEKGELKAVFQKHCQENLNFSISRSYLDSLASQKPHDVIPLSPKFNSNHIQTKKPIICLTMRVLGSILAHEVTLWS